MAYKYRKDLRVAAFLAYKSLLFNKKSLFLISCIIGLTYLSGIFIGGVIYGMKLRVEREAIDTTLGNIMLLPKEKEEYIYDVDEILKKLTGIPGIIAVSPRFIMPATLMDKDGKTTTVFLTVVEPEKERKVNYAFDNIIEGKCLSKGTQDGIMIGGVVTKKYGIFESVEKIDVSAGDKVKVITPFGEREMKILGIFKADLMDVELYTYVNKEQVRRVFNLNPEDLNVATQIVIKTGKNVDEKKMVKILKQLGIDARIHTWKEELGILDQFTGSLMIMNKIAIIVSIIVAFGTIYIIMYINALQKRSQLGILKAVGIKSNVIILSYTLQAFIYGLCGILAGLILIKLAVKYFTFYPIHTPIGGVTPVIQMDVMCFNALFILLSSIFAGYFASRGIVHERILDMIFKG